MLGFGFLGVFFEILGESIKVKGGKSGDLERERERERDKDNRLEFKG